MRISVVLTFLAISLSFIGAGTAMIRNGVPIEGMLFAAGLGVALIAVVVAVLETWSAE